MQHSLTTKSRSRMLYASVFIIHVFIAAVAFIGFRLHPFDKLFYNAGDGIKNIFTMITYVREPITHAGIFKYNSFQYPFGEYVYYTDNTPLFSIPFRWVCQHIYDLTPYTIIIFYVIVILNIVLCGLLLLYLFRRFIKQDGIAFILAIVMPWTNMQIFRIWCGNYAFSFTSLILLAICLLMLWHKHRGNVRRQLLVGLGMVLLSFLSFLAQGYYLAIITIFIAAMLFFYGLYYRRERAGRFSMIASVVYGVTAVALTISVIALTDPYLPLRREAAHGYDWSMQKTHLYALFTYYDFQNIVFPFSYGGHSPDAELASYLGNIGLYAVLIFGIAVIISLPFRRKMVSVQKEFFADPLKGAIVLGSLIMLSVSMGEHYSTEGFNNQPGFQFINITNPMFFLHQLTNRVEQFRSLERFVWPFYFAFYIWIAYAIAAVYRGYGRGVRVAIIAGMLFLGGAELVDYTNKTQSRSGDTNPFNRENLAQIKPKHITDYSRYQAILPIPYYHAGSEDYDYTLNDDDWWTTHNYRLSYLSHLPLMSCKMSRTPPAYNIMLMNFVAKDSIAPEMAGLLSDKPILVAIDTELAYDSTKGTLPPPNTLAADYYRKANQFARRNHLKAIDSLDKVIYYEWYPPAAKGARASL